MKKKLKWLLLGSLMCAGVGSGFQPSYGMFNDKEEISQEQRALESGISDVEIKKVRDKFLTYHQHFTYRQIVIGNNSWNTFEDLKDSDNVSNENKLELLMNALKNGHEEAIKHLLKAYQHGWYGLHKNHKASLELAKHYAMQGSEIAISYFLDAYRFGLYGLKTEGLKFAQHYAEKGSEIAIDRLLYAYLSLYKLKKNDPEAQTKGLELAQKYTAEGSIKAIEHLIDAYQFGWYGLDKDDQEVQKKGLELAEYYAEKGIDAVNEFLKNHQ